MSKRRISKWRRAVKESPCGCNCCWGDNDKYFKLKGWNQKTWKDSLKNRT